MGQKAKQGDEILVGFHTLSIRGPLGFAAVEPKSRADRTER